MHRLVKTTTIRHGAVNMVFLYHQDVQDRCEKNGLIRLENASHLALGKRIL